VAGLPTVSGRPFKLYISIPDFGGSTGTVIDAETAEVVESISYQPFGAVDSDYRTSRWNYAWEPYRFKGMREEREFGAVYFGHRFVLPGLNRWLSPDPLATRLGVGDVNPYGVMNGSPIGGSDPEGLDDPGSAGAPCLGKESVCYGLPWDLFQQIGNAIAGGGPGGGGTASDNTSQPRQVPPRVIRPSEFNPFDMMFQQSRYDAGAVVSPAAINGFNQGIDKQAPYLAAAGVLAGAQLTVVGGTVIGGPPGIAAAIADATEYIEAQGLRLVLSAYRLSPYTVTAAGFIKVAAQGMNGDMLPEGALLARPGAPAAVQGFEAIGSTGTVGEAELRQLGGQSQVRFATSLGDRIVDQLVDDAAHESKVGYQALRSKIAAQVAKDLELLRTGQVEAVYWHFYRSPVTGKIGPSNPLQRALGAAGIKVIVH
jgi:RHS repeat-associated protein